MSSGSTPAFRLYLLRHAQAGWPAPSQRDFDRQLDETGVAQAELIAETAAERGFLPDAVVCSTAVRCRQTVEAFRRAIGEDLPIDFIDALYTGNTGTYRDLVSSRKETASLMVVGHNPMMEELLRDLLGPDLAARAAPESYPPAGFAVIDFDRPEPEAGLSPGRLAGWLAPER